MPHHQVATKTTRLLQHHMPITHMPKGLTVNQVATVNNIPAMASKPATEADTTMDTTGVTKIVHTGLFATKSRRNYLID